jgi:hypothetical protein
MEKCKCCLGVNDKNFSRKKSEYCEFCDEKNDTWYMPNKLCHNKDTTQGACWHTKGYKYKHCYDCGAIKSVVDHWKSKGEIYLGNGIFESELSVWTKIKYFLKNIFKNFCKNL